MCQGWWARLEVLAAPAGLEPGLQSWGIWVPVPPLPLTAYTTLDKFHDQSLSFLVSQNEILATKAVGRLN